MAVKTQLTLEQDRKEPCDCGAPPEEHEILLACRAHHEEAGLLVNAVYKPGGILELVCPAHGCTIAEIAVAP